jgi:hypothetical protein
MLSGCIWNYEKYAVPLERGGERTSFEINSNFSGFGSSGGSDPCEDANGEEENICEGLEEGGDEAMSIVRAFDGEEGNSAISDTISCEP